jgi:hypothetical protein
MKQGLHHYVWQYLVTRKAICNFGVMRAVGRPSASVGLCGVKEQEQEETLEP